MGNKATAALDIALIGQFFPKLLLTSKEGELLCFSGEIDICDSIGVYWDTFEIIIRAPNNYPYGVPTMQETGMKIERIADRHISSNGYCCVAIDHVLLYQASKQLMIIDFIKKYVHPYLANHLYFEAKGHYSNEEYLHGFSGIRQFYRETLQAESSDKAITLLESVLNRKIPGRNAKCICGSSIKFKKCHLIAVQFLQKIGRKQVEQDYLQFVLDLESDKTSNRP